MAVSFVILVMVWGLANEGGGGEYCMGEKEGSPAENTVMLHGKNPYGIKRKESRHTHMLIGCPQATTNSAG